MLLLSKTGHLSPAQPPTLLHSHTNPSKLFCRLRRYKLTVPAGAYIPSAMPGTADLTFKMKKVGPGATGLRVRSTKNKRRRCFVRGLMRLVCRHAIERQSGLLQFQFKKRLPNDISGLASNFNLKRSAGCTLVPHAPGALRWIPSAALHPSCCPRR